MFLTKSEIYKEWTANKIQIEPFSVDQLNPNSYDVRLGPVLYLVANPYDHGDYDVVDMKQPQQIRAKLQIPNEGLVLRPGLFYLGNTYEQAGSTHYVPMLDGKSGVARSGLSIHITAGFGDLGFNGHWTLEITVVAPTRVYPFQRIGQVSFHTVQGEIEMYHGNHGMQRECLPVLSKMHKAMENDEVARLKLWQAWCEKELHEARMLEQQ